MLNLDRRESKPRPYRVRGILLVPASHASCGAAELCSAFHVALPGIESCACILNRKTDTGAEGKKESRRWREFPDISIDFSG